MIDGESGSGLGVKPEGLVGQDDDSIIHREEKARSHATIATRQPVYPPSAQPITSYVDLVLPATFVGGHLILPTGATQDPMSLGFYITYTKND